MRSLLVLLSSLGLAVAACEDQSVAPPDPTLFPAGFHFGTAIAGFQAEMGCPTVKAEDCEDPNSDWYDYITKGDLKSNPALFMNGDPPSAGPGFFETYPQDLDRAQKELNNNALRTSIEWSRIFPTSTVGVSGYEELKKKADPKALDYYHKLFAAMKARGLRPFITLNHYSLPSWIHDTVACNKDVTTCKKRGWVDKDPIVTEIAKYAGFAGREFGGEIDMWATLNEPLMAVVVAGYLLQTPTRTNPPGVQLAIDEAKKAATNMIEAHARMYDAVKEADKVDADGDGKPALVGTVYNITVSTPKDPNRALDVTAAKNLDYLLNQMFLDGVVKGQLDATWEGKPVRRDDLAGRMDFLGINYYNRALPTGLPEPVLPALSPFITCDITSLPFDYQYPKGLYEALKWTHERYKDLPLYVSETGAEDPKDDGTMSKWIVETMVWVRKAIDEGVPVRGYYFWTLMDNYEWNHGMDVKLGLYAVDKNDKTKTRKARSAMSVYARIAKEQRVAPDLAAKYPLRDK